MRDSDIPKKLVPIRSAVILPPMLVEKYLALIKKKPEKVLAAFLDKIEEKTSLFEGENVRKIPHSVVEVIHLLFLAINQKLNSTPFEKSMVEEDISDDWLSNHLTSLSQIDNIESPPRCYADNNNEQTSFIDGAPAPEMATETTDTQESQNRIENG